MRRENTDGWEEARKERGKKKKKELKSAAKEGEK